MGIFVHLICCFALFCLLLMSTKCEFIKEPKNTLASFGETVVLPCCSDIPNPNLQWRRYVDGLPQKITICSSETCHDSGYQIDEKDPGCSNLIVFHASASEAGLYNCEEVDTEHKAGAYLIVFHLNCGANSTIEQNLIEGADVLFRCTTIWTGGSHLAMSWTSENGAILNRTEFTKPQKTYTSMLKVTVHRPELNQYTATVQFLSSTITDSEVDRSEPRVNWSSTKRSIAYPVIDLQTGCKNDYCERQIDDTVFCGALGYPRPDIRWYEENGELVGERLKISSSGEQRFNCVATNTVGGKTYTVFRVIKVLGKQSENTKALLQIQETLLDIYKFVHVAVTLGILGIIVSIIYIVVNVYKCLKSRENVSPSALLQRVISQLGDVPSRVNNDQGEREERVPLQDPSSHENGDGDADAGQNNQNSSPLLGEKESCSVDEKQPTSTPHQVAEESESESTV